MTFLHPSTPVALFSRRFLLKSFKHSVFLDSTKTFIEEWPWHRGSIRGSLPKAAGSNLDTRVILLSHF